MQPSNNLSGVIDFIEAHYSTDISLKDLAMRCFLCPSYFIRRFKKEYNVSPYQYLINKRLDEARELLHQRNISITEICWKVGYEDISAFSKSFKRRFGLSPAGYRNNLLD